MPPTDEQADPIPEITTARTLLRANDPGGARTLLERYLEQAPKDGPQTGIAHMVLGRALTLQGDDHAAEQAYARAVKATPELDEAFERWGKLCLAREAWETAAAVFSQWVSCRPSSEEASFWLSVSTRSSVPERMAPASVARLYDGFADDFDTVMERVDYLGPMLIGSVLERDLGPASANLDVLDAGCGTGLCALELAPYAGSLSGIDLSARMLEQAAARGLYSHLQQGDFTALPSTRQRAFDLVCCAEALIYYGDLQRPVRTLSQLLRPHGLLVLTVEQAKQIHRPGPRASGLGEQGTGVQDFELGASGRYAHTDDHVELALAECGMTDIQIHAAMIRSEAGEPVMAWLASARKCAA